MSQSNPVSRHFKACQHHWAIDSQDGGLLGVFCFDQYYKRPYFQSLTTALFETRHEARDALRKIKGKAYVAWPDARVVKVDVKFATVGDRQNHGQ